ncbi:uncharacterized protein FIBRA_03452 [Fibroporia radiculosa]|uniref:Uncharacterized protein n=1 Tax=Fibroporia radiculosa TaxID=599839 RepID=J4I9M1_9APHY|nr:uncharacterized protein FIBRA_03452 [Fibroporia radiculosa]CCM01401.1 predicted protein [Fibroporia radiculosa]
MKSTVLVVAAAALVGVSGLQINTPSDVTECIPTLFTWSGGVSPYYIVRFSHQSGKDPHILFYSPADALLSLEPGSDPTGAPLQEYGPLTGTSYTWPTNITSGTSISLTIKDSTGATEESAPFTVGAGSNSCLNAASTSSTSSSSGSSSATSSGATSTTSTSASSSGASTTTTTSGATTTTSSGTTSTGGAATTSASGKTSGALVNVANLAFAGVAGVAVAAFLA